MIEDSGLDAGSVCTPSGIHADVTVTAAEAGAHVFREKPLDVYADRMDRMIDACDRNGVTLAGIFQKRFALATRRAKEAINVGGLGEIVVGDAAVKWFRSQEYYDSGRWRGSRDMDGGVLLNQAIHSIDRLQWLLGGVESVQAVTETHHRELESETTATLSLRFENDALGTVSATIATKGGTDRTEINGTDGSIVLSGTDLVTYETGTGDKDPYEAETESRGTAVEDFEWGNGHTAVV